jgi:transposase
MRVIKYHVKDSSKKRQLEKLSFQVNFVWNICNEMIRKRWKKSRQYTSKKEVNQLVKSASKELKLNQQTIEAIGYELLLRVRKHKKQIRFRTRKKTLAKNIHAKIKHSRKDAIEKFTTKIAEKNSLVVGGKIKSKRAKSTYDNGWFLLKTRLSHKVVKHGGRYIEVNEYFTSKTCSNCRIVWNLLKGQKILAVREYKCPCCGVEQDRDTNAARNILRIGHDSLPLQEKSPTKEALVS